MKPIFRSAPVLLSCLLGMTGGVLYAAQSDALFELYDPGTEKVVNYNRYGEFTHAGTAQYRYLIRDREGLAKAVGEGVYPNVTSLLKDPMYQKFKYNGKLEGSQWDFANTDDTQAGFYKWASAQEQPGVKQFYTGDMLEKSGLTAQAVKAYQACAIHFPKAAGSTFWKTPWYIGPTALDRIGYITRTQPELGMRLQGGRIRIQNCFDDDVHNDVVQVDPGKIVSISPSQAAKPAPRIDLNALPIKQQLGKGRIKLQQFDNGHWRLIVDGKPKMLRAISYGSTPVGKSPDDGSLVGHRDWMLADINNNQKIDGPYDAWVDKNGNEKQEANEPVVGDYKLLKEMGANAIRLYHRGYNKEVLKDLYDNYGLYTIMGDYLGAYTIGSGADWYAGTDYTDSEQQKKMMQSVREMVETYKEESYVVMWVLGNENNYGNANNSRQKPDAYYTFVNKVAKMIKAMDPSRPVAICNGDLLFLDKVAKLCPDIDVYGANAYRGSHGFGDSMWRNLQEIWGKPVLITEFGCPAYHHRRDRQTAEDLQVKYLRSNWVDIEYNSAGQPGAGNSLGGVLFQWMDEWWKAGPPPQYDAKIQDIVGQFGGPFPDGWSYEEWYGVVGQGTGKNSPFMRQLRKSYFLFKNDMWNAKKLQARGMPE
jgi:hypothetical protein